MARLLLSSPQKSLRYLLGKTQQLRRINVMITPLLPVEMAEYVQVANLEKQTLMLCTSNAAIATQVRFLAPTLLNRLRAYKDEIGIITRIKCSVSYTVSTTQTYKRQPTQVAQETANHVQNCAKRYKNTALGKALETLAKNMRSDTRDKRS